MKIFTPNPYLHDIQKGDLLQLDDKRVFMIWGFGDDMRLYISARGSAVHLENVKPIPLAFKWLDIYGDWLRWEEFKLVGGWAWKHRYNEDVRLLYIHRKYYLEYCGQTVYKPLRFLHELQGMYRTLFGKELIVRWEDWNEVLRV